NVVVLEVLVYPGRDARKTRFEVGGLECSGEILGIGTGYYRAVEGRSEQVFNVGFLASDEIADLNQGFRVEAVTALEGPDSFLVARAGVDQDGDVPCSWGGQPCECGHLVRPAHRAGGPQRTQRA